MSDTKSVESSRGRSREDSTSSSSSSDSDTSSSSGSDSDSPPVSPVRRSRTPTRVKSKSPARRKSKSPPRRKSKSPARRKKSISPARKRSKSPVRRLRSGSPVRRKSRSPVRRKSRSPVRRKSRSPVRRKSRSPVRRKSRSPIRRKSRSPARRQKSRSPVRRQKSRSPVRRQKSRSPVRKQKSRSPVRRKSRSPPRKRSRSPARRRSRSPPRRRSRSPARRRSRSPAKRRSPARKRSRSPARRASRSPLRSSRSSARRRSRSPTGSSIPNRRRRERSNSEEGRSSNKGSKWEQNRSPSIKREIESPREEQNTSEGKRFGLEKKRSKFDDGLRGEGLKETKEKWGKPEMWEVKKEEEPVIEKEKINMETSGKLAEDTNMFRGVVIKYNEPPEAKLPTLRWRLYPFKGEESLPALYIHRQSAYLIGRDRKIADIPVDHPSCSKQHAAFQYRSMPFERVDGSRGRRVLPYLIDLGSANGTFLNGQKIDPQRYYEVQEKDVIKFGFSSKEFVVLNENSAGVEESSPKSDKSV